jgi:prepilin-type N-terminal cleavage/methylation domain-containing protein/prepilin-type processing-associated H-X9-DG protein
MKPRCSNQSCQALTLIEVVMVIVLLAVLAAVLLPGLSAVKVRGGPGCYGNLRQIGLAFKIWAGDNHDKYPMEISVINGGAMELAAAGNATAIFQVMSNELSTPRVLLCPKDAEHKRADKFDANFSANNISYFVGLDAGKGNSQALLSGDDNLQFGGNTIRSGLRLVSKNVFYTWNTNRHNNLVGNILLADGSVQALGNSGLTNQICQTNFTFIRLAIP